MGGFYFNFFHNFFHAGIFVGRRREPNGMWLIVNLKRLFCFLSLRHEILLLWQIIVGFYVELFLCIIWCIPFHSIPNGKFSIFDLLVYLTKRLLLKWTFLRFSCVRLMECHAGWVREINEKNRINKTTIDQNQNNKKKWDEIRSYFWRWILPYALILCFSHRIDRRLIAALVSRFTFRVDFNPQSWNHKCSVIAAIIRSLNWTNKKDNFPLKTDRQGKGREGISLKLPNRY